MYRHLDVASHKGWLKVGETLKTNIKGDGKNRRIEDQNTAANIAYEVLYTTDAITNSGKIFSDRDIHELLEGMDIEREETINPDTKRKSEWFKTDIGTVIKAIEYYKMEAEITGPAGTIKHFTLRREQQEAVSNTHDYYDVAKEDANLEPSFLWNAKPRFGKTLTAYCFAAEIAARKVLIVTNRPAIADSWYTDFCKFDFADTNQNDGRHRWLFSCSEAVKTRLGNPAGAYVCEDIINNTALYSKNLVHFISLQDIKGRESADNYSEFKEKNKWIFKLDWDLVIIDESHEGADTAKALHVFDKVQRGFTLHLSGTPFKALASNRFTAKQIFNWSYADEQESKQNWPIIDGPNPYAELPKMNIFTYQLSRALQLSAEEARDEGSEYAFDLAEFFRIVKVDGEDHFAYEDKVRLFIRNLSNPEFEYPFSDAKNRENLRHTFWLLPGVKACEQMKKILLEDEYFKNNYAAEDIIMAAGNGDEDRITKTALDEVRKRIGKPGTAKHPLETRTITLSCGQLTTGVTIPEWSAVLMLNNCKSPALYMQTAFRAQNPCSLPTSGGECVIKENCYVFDFAPDRILQTIAEMAESITHGSSSSSREDKVRILINFLPVIAEDNEGRMKYLDANEVLTIPLKLITEEVVSRGFMSNRLFENISGIFGCPKSIKEIIEKMDETKGTEVERDQSKKSKLGNKPRVWVDKDKKIHINEDIVVATTDGLLGDKKYVEIGSDEAKEIQDIITEVKAQARAAGHSAPTINAEVKAIEKKLPRLVATLPEPEPQPGDSDYFEKETPDEKPSKAEKTDEQKVRDRLRGFARTIPSFLMAYGSADTKLSNFGDNIPEEVFQELTNISKAEFLQLRDGMDFQEADESGKPLFNEDGSPKMGHFKGLFNESVFNSSVAEFVARRQTLSCYYHTDAEEDIFEYIPPQANNQIFTPRRVVKMMVDMLEENSPGIFANPDHTFIDLYMKSGMYITEIVKRIFEQTRNQYDSDTACVKHILEHQVYGFAPTSILQAITQNYIFGFDDSEFIARDHFRQLDTAPLAKDGALIPTINALFGEGQNMKFTAVIGNPPYQENIDNRGEQPPIYHYFYDASAKLAQVYCLITPGRFLFRVGKTPAEWNEKMLNDEHFKVTEYFPDSKKIFPNTDIKGGVAIGLGDSSQTFGAIGTYLANNNLRSILAKIKVADNKKTFSNLIFSNTAYKYSDDFFSDNPQYITRVSGGSARYLSSSVFDKFPEEFHEQKPDGEYIQILGRKNNERKILYFRKKYLSPPDNFANYKVFVPSSNGSGALGEVFSTPMIGAPMIGATETFISIGNFSVQAEAEACLKYIKSKFLRCVLGMKKVTQGNKRPETWSFIPLQDFTKNSDIDWSKPIPEIDRQLYRKYNLSAEEISFIEQNIKPME